MKNCVILLAGMIVSFSACRKTSLSESEIPKQQESVLTAEEAERFVLLHTDYTLSKADVLKKAQAVAEVLGKIELKTKSEKVYRRSMIADSIVSAVPLTKNDGTTVVVPKIYVVAFGPDAGFALFAGDKRIHEVLAFSGEGNYSSDGLHPGMEYFIQCLQTYMVSEIDRLEAMRGDSIYNRLVYKYGRFGDRSSVPQTRYPVWNGIEYVDMPVDNITEEWYQDGGEPVYQKLLVKSKWDQGWPYNQKVAATYGGGVPVGCVATAVAQIMNFHQTGTYNGKTYAWSQFPTNDWSGVSTDVLSSIGDLFFDLGKSENLNMNYKVNGSSAFSDNVPRTFERYGFISTGMKDYSTSSMLDNLRNNRPVYMRGEDPTNGGAHAWVVGGIMQNEAYSVYRINYWYEGHLQGSEYVKRGIKNYNGIHLNWGWGGQYDCWTIPGTFDTHGTYNFTKYLKMICDIRVR